MKNSVALVSAFTVAACVIGASAATTPSVSLAVPLQKAPDVQHQSTTTVLYDQTPKGSPLGFVSQRFDSAHSSYDSQIADDFTVPTGKTWIVSEVDVVGAYSGGPAKSENVFIYKPSAKGLPKLKVMEFDKIKGKDSAGNFAITLPQSVELKPGTYFVSVQINMDHSSGVWGWGTTVAGGRTFGNPATYKNPGNGFLTGCTTWFPLIKCVDYPQGPDMLFKLLGTSRPETHKKDSQIG